MKAVPILAITNTVALALVLMLYVQQNELESKLRTARSGPRSTATSVDEAALEARLLETLRGQVPGASRAASPAAEETVGEARVSSEGGETPDLGSAPEGEQSPDTTLRGAPMERFRANVRRANELNREADRVNRVVSTLDRLASENKIASLNPSQKKVVASAVLSAADKVPDIWRKFRGNPELRSLPREERGAMMREAYDALRAEAQTTLENVVTAADAKTILDEGLREARGPWRGRDSGGTTRSGDRRGR